MQGLHRLEWRIYWCLLSEKEARQRLWFVDSRGLVVKNRENLKPHNLPYAHEHANEDFMSAIESIRPNILIGATGRYGAFSQQAISLMAKINSRPVIFALSNPTSHAECTAAQAYEWTDGRAIFASGSPSESVTYKGDFFKPGQGNNAYIFPGLGLGVMACQASYISDEMFMAAAKALSSQVDSEQLEQGSIYPPLNQLRQVSFNIALAVAEMAYKQGYAQVPLPENLSKAINELIYDPTY